ncbi:4a-hydroxytetrahydrobiopterin dehydratase [Fluviicola sp.]|uniref:4a-hydroxytetrahydrobiopterin dehydratase n=1 Tax=Fluviicola sp. TaxID=1917219 RepID=UPI00261C2057|nr:4a-hydroxytetrahydrobiopterin dehydratase [Fluviicola sp.]
MHWNLIAHQFRTVVQFKNQTELADFVLQIAKLADQQDHHPDLTIRHCSELSIAVYSHDQHQITTRDHALVEAITNLYDEVSQMSV